MSNESEVARIRQQIEEESQAMENGLTGISMSASHTIIYNRYEAIGQCRDALASLVGGEQADWMMAESYTRGIEGRAK